MLDDIRGQSPNYIIFNKLYIVRVRNIDTLDKDYIQQRGLPYTGDRAVDNEFANQLIDKYVTIAQMAEWYSQGISLRFTNARDMEEIYAVIYQHIKIYQENTNKSINITRVPIEDLKMLSDFASELYSHISDGEFLKEETKAPVYFEETSAIDIDKLFRPIPKKEQEKQEQERISNHYLNTATPPVEAPHENMLKEIEEKVLYRRQEWRPR